MLGRSRYNRMVSVVLSILLGALFFGCSEKETTPLLPEEYTSWERTTEEVLDHPIPGHGSNQRIIYINETGTSVPLGGDGSVTYPTGTIVIKEVYNDPMVLTAMVKDPENPDARGGWVWLTKNPETGEESLVREEFCITCHANANEQHPYGDGNRDERFRDYLFYPYRAQ